MERHPFQPFLPIDCKYLILGSFPTKKAHTEKTYTWYYESKRNQFWKILEKVYDRKLNSIVEKKALFDELHIGLMDIILTCERKDEGSKDTDLYNLEHNPMLESILISKNIQRIFSTSEFVAVLFKRFYMQYLWSTPTTELIELPSPSPRNARMSFLDKVAVYKSALPTL